MVLLSIRAASPSMDAATNNYQFGAAWRFAQYAGRARAGALTHPGVAVEIHMDANI
jgi:dihydroxy-acid dehydratase